MLIGTKAPVFDKFWVFYPFNCLSRSETDSPCASRLSERAKVTADWPMARSAWGDIFEIVVRFIKVNVDNPLENRAERDVGKT